MTERNDDITTAGGASDPGAVRDEMKGTRERMGETLERIGERLNPRHLAEQVKGSVSEATRERAQAAARGAADRVSTASEPALEKARQYPLAAVAVAAGLGWLLAGRRRGAALDASKMASSDDSHSSYPTPRWSSAASGTAASGRSAGSTSGKGSALSSPRAFAGTGADGGSSRENAQASAALGEMGERSTSAPRSAGSIDDWRPAGRGDSSGGTGGASGSAAYGTSEDEGGEGRGTRVKAAASRLAGGARSAVGGAGTRVKEVGGSVAERTRERAQETPLIAGAATLAAGLAAGFAVPTTEREVELMGEARDRFVERVRGAVQQTRGKAKEAASDAVQQAKAAAKQAVQGQK